jgi:hypothetical protein
MTSFQLSVTPSRRAAARFVNLIRGEIQKAYAESPEIRQTDIAREIDVHRSVINRQIRGLKDMSIGRAGEIIWALGREPKFELVKPEAEEGCNEPALVPSAANAPPEISFPSSAIKAATIRVVEELAA